MLVMFFPCIFLCCIREAQLFVTIFPIFSLTVSWFCFLICLAMWNKAMSSLWLNLSSKAFGSNYHMFCSVLGFGIIFLTATIFQTFYYLLFSVFTSFMELFLHRIWCLHLPFFYQPQTFSLAERTLFKIFVYFIKVIRIICPVICKKIV